MDGLLTARIRRATVHRPIASHPGKAGGDREMQGQTSTSAAMGQVDGPPPRAPRAPSGRPVAGPDRSNPIQCRRRAAMEYALKARLDYGDYTAIPGDGKRYELFDGDIHVTPAPSPLHQRLVLRLARRLQDTSRRPPKSSCHRSMSSSARTTSPSRTSRSWHSHTRSPLAGSREPPS